MTDKEEQYKAFVREAIQEIAAELPPDPMIRVEVTLDDEHGHYQIMEVGWDDYRRVHGVLAHCDVRDGKIYVEHDGTSIGIADMLRERGVPNSDIVLGFHHPSLRQYTPFALA
jgi:ketopantoate reductase